MEDHKESHVLVASPICSLHFRRRRIVMRYQDLSRNYQFTLTLIQLYHGSQTALGRSSLSISLSRNAFRASFSRLKFFTTSIWFSLVCLRTRRSFYQQPFPVSEIFERLLQYLITVSGVVAVLNVAHLQSEADVISLLSLAGIVFCLALFLIVSPKEVH